jgi:predicted phosphodiesterase
MVDKRWNFRAINVIRYYHQEEGKVVWLCSFPLFGDAMTVIKHNLGDFKDIHILPLADLHLGDIHADFKRIQSWIEYIQTNDNVFCILNGDLMDAAIQSSIGDTYGASLQPMEQLRQCIKLFEPIKEKILAVLPGNHELRIYKSDGLDLTEVFCSQLGIVDRYSSASALLFIRFGQNTSHNHNRLITYTLYCVHGSGGGKKEASKVQRLIDLASIVDSDIYLHSHTHLPAIAKNSYYRTSITTSSVQKVDRLFVNTSSALDWGGYGELQSYKPNSLDTPVIHLDGRQKRATATL